MIDEMAVKAAHKRHWLVGPVDGQILCSANRRLSDKEDLSIATRLCYYFSHSLYAIWYEAGKRFYERKA